MSRAMHASQIIEASLDTSDVPDELRTPEFFVGYYRRALEQAMHALNAHDCGVPSCTGADMIGCARPH